MKKFIVSIVSILCVMSFSSCSVTYLTKGDMVLLDNNGKVLKEYDDATFQSETYECGYQRQASYAIKDGGGISFVDKYGNSNFVSGGIIIIENIHTLSINNLDNSDDSNISENRRNSMKYKELGNKIDKLKKKQRDYKDDTVKYAEIEKEIQELSKQRMEYLGKIRNIY